jgi:hypothetical protein
MIDKIAEKLEDWTAVWGEVVFSPGQFFSNNTSKRAVSSAEFFVGSILLAYAVTFLGSILFFSVFYLNILRSKLPLQLSDGLSLVTKLFVVYMIILFVSFFVSGALSYAAARFLGSRATFARHFKNYFYLSALEPLAAFSTVLLFLNGSKLTVLLCGALVAFLGARGWGLFSGYKAVRSTHSSSPHAGLIFVVGFLPSWIALNTGLALLVWVAAQILVRYLD